MFDVLGFSRWVENTSLDIVLASYRQLIDAAVLRPRENGNLSMLQTREGSLFVVARAPRDAYFSDTILV